MILCENRIYRMNFHCNFDPNEEKDLLEVLKDEENGNHFYHLTNQ